MPRAWSSPEPHSTVPVRIRHPSYPRELLRKRNLSLDLKGSGCGWGAGTGLATADTDLVLAFRDDRLSSLGHNTEIAGLELELDSLRCAGIKMHALESAQGTQRRSLCIREAEI